jgi:hypothetical protein
MLIFNIKFCDVMEDIMSYIRKNLYYFGKIADVIFLVKFAGEHRAH